MSLPMPVLQPSLITPQVVRELSPSLLAFAYRRVGQLQEAEDLVQETWLSALRSAATFEGRSSLRTWLGVILKRRIAERYRRRQPLEPLSEEEPCAQPLLGAPEPLDAALAAGIVRCALASLSEQERQAVTQSDLLERECDHSCEHLGVSRGHLRVLLFRGRGKLADALRASGIAL